MKYNEKYDRYIDDDCVIYRKNKEGKLVQVNPSVNNCGYEYIYFKDNKKVYVHRLVYETFKGEIPAGMEIDHFDRNKHNNNPDNLRVVTRVENCLNRKYDSNFNEKFRVQYRIKENESTYKHPAYNKEHTWYYRHNHKCRWE